VIPESKGEIMKRINWREIFEHKGDAFLTFLHDLEQCCRRAIHGIWLFIVKKIPELFRDLLTWLYETFFYTCRVAVRVARLAGVFAAWLIVVFGPFALFSGPVAVTWAVLAIAGSVYGVQRQVKKQSVVQERQKELFRARA